MRSVVEALGKLTITLANEAAGREAGYRTFGPIVGAFDAQVDFLNFSVTAAGADEGWGGIRFKISDNDLAEIKRSKTGTTNRISARAIIDGTTYTAGVDSTAASGKFRIKRNGLEISLQYDIGAGWVVLLSKAAFSSSPGKLALLAGVSAALVNVVMAYDNFNFYESPNSIYEDHIPKCIDGEEEALTIQVTRKGHREYNNRINVQYTKRDKDYVQGIAMADDIVDIDRYGLQDATMQLDGFCTFPRANKMAWLFLRKGLMSPQNLDFKLGPQSLGCAPGDVRWITEKNLELDARAIRIVNISEGPKFTIDVNAVEENDLGELIVSGDDTSQPGQVVALRGDPGNAIRLTVYEYPSLYSETCKLGVAFSRPINEAWAASALFCAYAAAGDYGFKESKTKNGITGIVDAVGKDGDTAYITVDLDYDYTLESLASMDALLTTPNKNSGLALTGAGKKIFRYQTVELLSPRKWKLTGLLYDLTEEAVMNSYGAIAPAQAVLLDTAYQVDVPDADKFRALYFKLASVNFAGQIQPLAGLGSVSITPQALCDKPLPPWGIKVGGVYLDAGMAATIAAGDISLAWSSRNRFGKGMYIYDRADAGGDDDDFKNFILEIYNGENLLRTVTQTGKSFTYTTAMQTADGGPFSAYTMKLKQEGALAFSDYVQFAVNTV